MYTADPSRPIPSRNISGALIFWAYIAAALFFTGTISISLHGLWTQQPDRRLRRRGCFIAAIYLALAITSFATLSYNMLNVLILEYSTWFSHSAAAQNIPLLSRLWNWSVESSLFVSFAEEITASPARWLWSQAELGISMVVSCWMGVEGRLKRPVPKLWAYFALLQILPTSIVVNLFILARTLAPAAASSSKQQVSPNKPSLLLAAVIMYFGCLIQAGRNVYDGPQLIKLVLMGRLMLLVPLVLGVRRVAADNVHQSEARTYARASTLWLPVVLTVALSTAQWYRLGVPALGRSKPSVLPTLSGLWDVKDEHPAVASLSHDVIQGVISLLLWQVVRT